MIGVLIADDQALVRAGFRMVLEAEDDIAVVGEAANGEQAVHGAKRLKPDVVLMDIRMPELDGIAATRQIAKDPGTLAPRARVLILTTFDLDEYVYDALGAGASGFLLKDSPPEQLVAAIRIVADGEALLAPSITSRLIEQFARSRPATMPSRRVSTSSPHVSSRSSSSWPAGCPMPRSQRGSSSATRPSRPTSRACSRSSACETASKRSCSPTSRASSGPATADGYGQSICSASSEGPSSISPLRCTGAYSPSRRASQVTVRSAGSTRRASSTPCAA